MTPKLTLSQRKRAAIIDAALTEFQAHGFSDTSMDAITLRANVSKRTVYNHFSSKDELFKAIALELLQQFHQATNVSYDPDRSLEEQLREIAEKEVEMVTSEAFIRTTRVMLAESIRSPEFSREIFNDSMAENPVADWIAAATADGRLKVKDPGLASEQFLSLLKGIFFWPQVAGYSDRLEQVQRDAVVESAVQMFLDHYRS